MPIPANYARLAWGVSPRGASGPRQTGLAVNWSQAFGDALEFGTEAWFIQGFEFMQSQWEGLLDTLFHTTTTLETLAISITGGGGSTIGNHATGVATGTLMPPEMAVIMQLRSTLPGRRGRGRMFFPDAGESYFDNDGILDNTVGQTFIDTVDELRGNLDGNLTGSEFAHGLNGAHILHAAGKTATPVPTRITASFPSVRAGWLRRRGR